jgi:hypothetical protein
VIVEDQVLLRAGTERLFVDGGHKLRRWQDHCDRAEPPQPDGSVGQRIAQSLPKADACDEFICGDGVRCRRS